MERDYFVEEEQSDEIVDHALNDITWLIKFYLEYYFNSKKSSDGKEIPKSVSQGSRYVDAAMNIDVCNGMDVIYDSINNQNNIKDPMYTIERQGRIAPDISYVLDVLKDCSHSGIPKQFSVGVLMAYMELCSGCKIIL